MSRIYNDDELLDVTPESLRIRKRILNGELRAKAAFKEKQKLQEGK